MSWRFNLPFTVWLFQISIIIHLNIHVATCAIDKQYSLYVTHVVVRAQPVLFQLGSGFVAANLNPLITYKIYQESLTGTGVGVPE